MNMAKQLDTKSIFRNPRHSCTPTMKLQKQKSGKKMPFDTATRKIKYVGRNLTKEVKDLYSENYTTYLSSAASDVYKRQRSSTMTKWDSCQGCKDGTIFANQ